MDARVAVVGAGIAGLAAGYRLREAGINPVIFEAGSFVGGRMSSEEIDGFIIDKAAYTFPEFHKNLTGLLPRIGLDSALALTSGMASTFHAGREYRIKIGSPRDFIKYELLDFKSKLRMIKLFLYARALGRALDLTNPIDKSFGLEAESAADYLSAQYGRDILEKIAYPIFCEIFLGVPEQNSKLAFLAFIKNLTRFKIFCFTHGMGMVPRKMADGLDVRLESPVERIAPSGAEDSYRVHVGGDNPETIPVEGVIVTTPPPQALKMVDNLPPEVAEAMGSVRYAPSVVVALALDRLIDAPSMINNVLRLDHEVLGTVVFDHHKGRHRAPQGKGLVTAVLSEPAGRALIDQSDEVVTHKVLQEMDSIFRGLSNHIHFTRVYRWPFGAVQLWPGSVRRQHQLRLILLKMPGRLLFAGDGLYKSSLEISFNTGISAAEEMIVRLG